MANLLTLGRAFKRCLQWELKERWYQSSALWAAKLCQVPGSPKIVSEYNQEILQSQTTDNPMALPGRAAQPSRDTKKCSARMKAI